MKSPFSDHNARQSLETAPSEMPLPVKPRSTSPWGCFLLFSLTIFISSLVLFIYFYVAFNSFTPAPVTNDQTEILQGFPDIPAGPATRMKTLEPEKNTELFLDSPYVESTTPTESERKHDDAWSVVKLTNQTPQQYQQALQQVVSITHTEPANMSFQKTLGIAQYRCGEYTAALETFSRIPVRSKPVTMPVPKRDSPGVSVNRTQPDPDILIFSAMSQHQLGQRDVAHTTLAEVQLAPRSTRTRESYQQTETFLKEANTLVASAKQSSRAPSDPSHTTPGGIADNHADDPNQLRRLLSEWGTVMDTDSDGNIDTVNLNGSQATDEILTLLNNQRHLITLGLWGTHITDTGLSHLSNLRSLRHLDLTETGVTDAGLRHLKSLPELSILTLNRTNISNKGLKHLRHCVQLSVLALNHTQITDEGLVHLHHLKMLHWLRIGNTTVTGIGMSHLAGMAQLKTLNLQYTRVSGIDELKYLSQLTTLSLSGTNITRSDRLELQKLLFPCVIVP